MFRPLSIQTLLVGAAFLFHLSVCAQVLSEETPATALTAIPFSSGGIRFDPYVKGTDPRFDALLAGTRDIDPIAGPPVIVWGQFTNDTDQDIVVITTNWDCIRTSDGVQRLTARVEWSVDDNRIYPKGFSRRAGFGLAPVRRPSARYIPDLPMTYLRLPATFGSKVLNRDSRDYTNCAPISWEIDAVILEDGTVLGKDGAGTVDLIRARKKAIDLVTEKMLALLDRQHDPTDMLNEYVKNGTDLADRVAFWCGRVAKIYLESPNQRARAAQLSTLPTLNLH